MSGSRPTDLLFYRLWLEVVEMVLQDCFPSQCVWGFIYSLRISVRRGSSLTALQDMATQNDNNPTIEAGGNPSPSTASPFLSTSSSSTTPTTTTNPVTPKPTDTAHQGSAPNTNPNDLGIGKAAGAIVGALVGGLLLGFVAAFVLLRHRAQHHSRRHSKSKRRRNSEKFFTSQEGSKPPKDDFGPQINAWESHLPQPADDNALRLRMKTFFHQAELHVEHFYTDAKSSSTRMANASTHSELSLFDSGQLPAPLAAVMPQTGSKMKVIKHSLIYFILGKISPEAHIPPSFLPIEYAALPSALERAKPEKNKSGEFSFVDHLVELHFA